MPKQPLSNLGDKTCDLREWPPKDHLYTCLVGRHALPAPLPTQATRAAGEGPAARSKTKSRRLETTKDGFSAVVNTHTVPTYVMYRDFLAFSDNT